MGIKISWLTTFLSLVESNSESDMRTECGQFGKQKKINKRKEEDKKKLDNKYDQIGQNKQT